MGAQIHFLHDCRLNFIQQIFNVLGAIILKDLCLFHPHPWSYYIYIYILYFDLKGLKPPTRILDSTTCALESANAEVIGDKIGGYQLIFLQVLFVFSNEPSLKEKQSSKNNNVVP